MRVIKRIYLFLPVLLIFSGCGNGADNLPELSAKVFKAFKAQDQTLLSACEPSTDQMEKAIELYLEDTTRTVEARKDAAINKTASLKLTLNQEFVNMLEQAKAKNIDWKTATIKDFNYTINGHIADYKDANVRVIIICGKEMNVLKYKAYLFGDRWYLIEGLAWEK
jgi:hypothetical protein